jgi:hypothetical protein
MNHSRSGAPRRAGRIAAGLAVAALLSTLVALLPAAGAGAAAGPRIVRSFPGGATPVRAGYSATTPAPVRAASTASAAPRTATIQVTYNGFSAQAQAAFQAAVDIWEANITSPKVIHVTANWTPLGSGVLGSAGPATFYLLSDNHVYPAALAEALCNCEGDVATEISANFNSAFSAWYLGTDGNTPSNRYDFMTVVLHELGHGLGFLSSFGVSGTQGGWGFTDGTNIYPLNYDLGEWSALTGGNQLTNTSVYPNPSSALKTQLTDGTVYFGGANVVAANGGARAKLYAPNPWQGGSSNSHFDEAAFPPGTPNGNALMTPILNNGEVVHVPGALTLALFKDIGWTTGGGATPSIAIGNRSAAEGTGTNTTFKFRVTLSAAAAGTVTVQYATAPGTATAGSDYTHRTGTVTFPAGVTTRNVTVTVIGDSSVEPNETFNVNLSNPVGATIADNQGRGTIQNDD